MKTLSCRIFPILILLFTFICHANAQNVGINNTNPDKDLDIIGNTRIQHSSTSSANTQLEILETGPATSALSRANCQVNLEDFGTVLR